ncbi:histone-lysine N-methyltransferase set-1-like [Mya arenaria]|uniref:histone-lysine N-methyltransferase set-1-like n=1 Tax=Mya arenaria TaxID=6604 RepID=UPI0022E3D9F1|nr:histone-lysine N-methyltransferase set-1-like [Mya arenaria]
MAACRDVFGQNQRPCRKKANQNYLQTNTAEIELNLCYMQYIDQYIGNGVFARQELLKGQFILEYRGELCKQQSDGDEMFKYHFRHNNKEYCIDASKDTCLACMVNDLDRYTKPNCKMVKVVDDRHQPRLCLYTTEMISKDTELRYDYGVADVPWRKRKMLLKMVIQLQILQRSQKHLKMPSVNQQKSWNMLIMML